MTLTPNQLTLRPLLVLELVEDECRVAPLPRSGMLQFVLAYLFSRTDGGQRWLFDSLWKHATEPVAAGGDTYAAQLGRSNGVTAALNGICRQVGVERTTDMMFGQKLAAKRRANVEKGISQS